jgi:type II secretion system protein I
MRLHGQGGFTLIEVVVAFAIFTLAVGAIYESFAGAVRRSAQADVRDQELLVAQSLLSQLRTSPAPWKAEDSGSLEGGWHWRTEVAPFDAAANERSSWRAFAVTVHVSSERDGAIEAVLHSIELGRVVPGHWLGHAG